MTIKIVHILLADDDEDDRFFFARALKKISVPSKLKTVGNGEALMNYLSESRNNIPDILFLDVNMPRKNGLECLIELKAGKGITDFPVIMYSTSLTASGADEFYREGAHRYIRKCDFSELVKYLQLVVEKVQSGNFEKVTRDKFVLSLQEA